MIDLTPSLRAAVAVLDDLGIPYVVVGSAAAGTWGVVRMTQDVDLVVMVAAESGRTLIDTLVRDSDLYVPEDDAQRAVRDGGAFNVLHPASGGKVQVFVRPPSDAFNRSGLDRRVRAEIDGVGCWVASPEDVVLAKLRWRLTSRSEVQWRDCVEIAATQELDRAYMDEWAEELGVEEDLAELLVAVEGGAGPTPG